LALFACSRYLRVGRPPRPTLFPYTTLFRSALEPDIREAMLATVPRLRAFAVSLCGNVDRADDLVQETLLKALANIDSFKPGTNLDRKSTRLNSSHVKISYAVFCLKKKS